MTPRRITPTCDPGVAIAYIRLHPCGHPVTSKRGNPIPEGVNRSCWVCARRVASAENKAWKAANQVEVDHSARIEESLRLCREVLVAAGFALEHTSESGSEYYKKADVTIRISDHFVPLTDERRDNREQAFGADYRTAWQHDIVVVNHRGESRNPELVKAEIVKIIQDSSEEEN